MTSKETPFQRDGETILTASEGRIIYHKVESPFVFTVVCLPMNKGDFWCDWWITGPLDPLPGKVAPRLLAQISMGIRGLNREDLLAQINKFWAESLQEIAFSSATAGGAVADPGRLSAHSGFAKKSIIGHHLSSHDALGHFSLPNRRSSGGLALRTAFMYELLRSMGVSKVQRTIAEFDSLNFERFYNNLKDGEVITLTATTVNQRLAPARKAGLIAKGQLKKGRTPNAVNDLRYDQHKDGDWVYSNPDGPLPMEYLRDESGTERKTNE